MSGNHSAYCIFVFVMFFSIYAFAQSPYDQGQDRVFEHYAESDTSFTEDGRVRITELERRVDKQETKIGILMAGAGLFIIAIFTWSIKIVVGKYFKSILLIAGLILLSLFLTPEPSTCFDCQRIPCTDDKQCMEQGCGICSTYQINKQDADYRCLPLEW